MGELFCPVCKRKNDDAAVNCLFCGAPMKGGPTTTRRHVDADGMPSGTQERRFLASLHAPETGLALYQWGSAKAIVVREEQEFILGRWRTGDQAGSVVDLTPIGGYDLGVSHRHVLIRRTGHGYELTDLDSTNGTYLNRKRLLPATPYPLFSGSSLRLGKMILYAVYRVEEGQKIDRTSR